MSPTRALILAAGRGSRLGRSEDQVPKCLVEIGRRRLIEHQLDTLADAGVGPVHMVLGYGASEVREVVGRRAGYMVNTRWESTNSLYSFSLARERLSGEMVVLNSDVLFAPAILDRLLDCPGSALAFDSGSGEAREQMKVRVEDGLFRGMAKDLPVEEAAGENLGLIKLDAAATQAAFAIAERLLAEGHEQAWVGAAIGALAAEHEIRAVDVAGLPWVEIDVPVDLARARAEVWPQIRGNAYRRRRAWRIAGTVLAGGLALGAAALVPSMIGLDSSQVGDWETVVIENLAEERVAIGKQSQNWWVLEKGDLASVTVFGPGPVRVESRLVDRPGDDEPYVLELRLDGQRVDWFKQSTRLSGKAFHPRWAISHKKRISTEVPEGAHELQVRLIAPREAICLVRVRQPEVPLEDEEP